MNHLLRRSVLAASGLAAFAWLAGCAAADTSTDSDGTVNVEPVVGELETRAPVPPSYDEDSNECPSAANALETQKRVNIIVNGIFNGGALSNKLFTSVSHPCTGPNADPAEIRLLVQDLAEKFQGGSSNDSWVTVGPGIADLVCGLKVAKRQVRSFRRFSGTTLEMPAGGVIAPLANELNKCWGVGHRALFHIDPNVKFTYFDPEPVKLTQNLTGSTGATAAGVFVNNNSATNVIKWYTDPSAGTLAGGTACATGSLASNSTTLKQIVVRASGLRECL